MKANERDSKGDVVHGKVSRMKLFYSKRPLLGALASEAVRQLIEGGSYMDRYIYS